MGCDFISLATPAVQDLNPYLPGKPADELERELDLTDVVKLASNENPLGPSPLVLSAVERQLGSMTLYPDGGGYRLKKAIAEHYTLEADQITLGNGSNDVLELIARAFVGPEHEVIYSEYAFIVYSIVSQAVGASAVVTDAKDWAHDLEAMLNAITENTKVIFIANPNNPTGTWLSKEALDCFLARVPETVLVVLDEAYTEYVQLPDFPSGLELLEHYPNLIVTRTFSKAFGLAGLRVGFSVSNQQIANVLSRVRQPFNVNSLALVAAETALSDKTYLAETIQTNSRGMDFFESGLTQLGIDFIPSVGNFITIDLMQDAMPVYQSMLEQGVIVRPLANYGMPHHLRISIGTQSENEQCLAVLAKVVSHLE